MSEPRVIEGTIAANWWVLAAAVQSLLFQDEQHARDEKRAPTTPTYIPGPDPQGFHFTLRERTPNGVFILGQLAGDIWLIRGNGTTVVRMLAAPEFQTYFYRIYQALDMLANVAHDFQREYEPSAEQVVEHYYAVRAAGNKISLKQLATQYSFNYKYLSSVKSIYDKRQNKIQVPLDK